MKTHKVLALLAKGRTAIREHFHDEHVGYYGQCYDFAVAVKRLLGSGEYVVLEGTDRINGTVIYHVFLQHGGKLLDASGIHDYQATKESLCQTECLRIAEPKEIEPYTEADAVDYFSLKLEQFIA